MDEEEPVVTIDYDSDIIDQQDEIDLDSDHEAYLQDSFQDDIVESIYQGILEYIRETGAPICEYITREKIENIINLLN